MARTTGHPVGRPRSEAARRAILAAAFELAAEGGAAGLNMEAIAKRASVSKETLYRWWSSKAEVLLDALVELGERRIPSPDTGDLAADLRTFMRATAQVLDPRTRRVLRTVAAQSAADADLADRVRERFLSHRRDALVAVLKPAVARGELDADRAALALDFVFGSLWYRLVFAVGPLDQHWADSVAAAVVAWRTPRRGGR